MVVILPGYSKHGGWMLHVTITTVLLIIVSVDCRPVAIYLTVDIAAIGGGDASLPAVVSKNKTLNCLQRKKT